MDYVLFGFYTRLGLWDLKKFRKVAFRAAYFWRMTPAELMATAPDLLAVAIEEMRDIQEEMSVNGR